MPFLENVTRGRGIPTERLAEVGRALLQLFGGKSPINDQCRSLLAALANELRSRGIEMPLYWGNRNWDPYLIDELRAIDRDGSPSGAGGADQRVSVLLLMPAVPGEPVRRGRDDTQVQIDRIRHYADHPGFRRGIGRRHARGTGRPRASQADEARLVFVTHSIPMLDGGRLPGPRRAARRARTWTGIAVVAAAVTRRVSARRGIDVTTSDLAYCSRSGPPSQPWLEPTSTITSAGSRRPAYRRVVVVPIGFVSDHMEVIFDLDTEAAATADRARAGLRPRRHRRRPSGVRQRAGRSDAGAGRRRPRGAAGSRPVVDGGTVGWYECRTDCCPNLRDPGRPALCEAAQLKRFLARVSGYFLKAGWPHMNGSGS